MRSILILLSLSFVLCSCDLNLQDIFSKKKVEEIATEVDKTLSPEKSEATVYVGGLSLEVPDFNRDYKELNLENTKISLPNNFGDSASNSQKEFYSIDTIKESEIRTLVSVLCGHEDLKTNSVYKVASKQQKFDFNFVEIIDPRLLSANINGPLVCSFHFVIYNKSRTKSEKYFIVQKEVILPKHEIHSNKLKIDGSAGLSDIKQTAIINKGNFDTVVLSHKKDFQGHLLLKCNDFSQDILLEDFSQGVFQSMYSNDYVNTVEGVQDCRVINTHLGLVKGATQLFKMDFDSVRQLTDRPSIDFEQLSHQMNSVGWRLNTGKVTKNIREYDLLIDNPNIPKVQWMPNAIQITGLPEDYDSKNYKDVFIEVKSFCLESRISNTEETKTFYENTYTFPLTNEFSLASITPEKFLIDAYPVYCKYHLSFKDNYGEHSNLKFETSNDYKLNFHLMTLSYQVRISYTKKELEELREKAKDQMHIGTHYSIYDVPQVVYLDQPKNFELLFFHKSSHVKFISDFYPDKMMLKCHNKGEDRQSIEFSTENLGYSLPMSSIFSHPKYNHIENNTCRLMFYKNDILMYFSADLIVRSYR